MELHCDIRTVPPLSILVLLAKLSFVVGSFLSCHNSLLYSGATVLRQDDGYSRRQVNGIILYSPR